MPFDPYYSRSEVSNSDLTSLKYQLQPQLETLSPSAKAKAFKLGHLVDGLVTEPKNCNHYRLTVGDETYNKEEWAWGKKMLSAIRKAAKKDPFLDHVLKNADTQKEFILPSMHFDVGCYSFDLPVRCRYDWWLGNFGGDLKTTSATTYDQFLAQIDWVDWDRSRAWYMDISGANQDFIYAISKKNFKVFFLKIQRGDEIYNRGREKYEELAFKKWLFV